VEAVHPQARSRGLKDKARISVQRYATRRHHLAEPGFLEVPSASHGTLSDAASAAGPPLAVRSIVVKGPELDT
jgi:hypothetical protein